MIVEHKDNLRELTYIVLVDSEGENDAFLQVHASRNSLLGVSDFAEYGLKFVPTKYKFNSDPSLNYLSEKSRSVVGLGIEDLEKIGSALFATNEIPGESRKKSKYSYFGSIDINDQTLTMVDIPSGYNTIYLFDQYPNLEDMQLDDPSGLDLLVLEEKWKVKIELEDRLPRKLLWFLLSAQGKVENVNLSYLMWSSSNNPERNRNQYLLRNDELAEIENKADIVGVLGGTDLVVDKNSNTLLGNKKIEYYPILSSILSSSQCIPNLDQSSFLGGGSFKKGTIVSMYSGRRLYLALEDTVDKPISFTGTKRFTSKLSWVRLIIGDNMEYQPTKRYETGSEVRYKGKSWVLTKMITTEKDGTTYTHQLIQKTPTPPSEESGWTEVVETIYNRNYPYSRLSRCKYNGYYWLSLVDNNVGNIPGISGSKWILESRLQSYFDKDISVIVTPSEGGKAVSRHLNITPDKRRVSIPVKLGNYCIDYITILAKDDPLDPVRLREGDNKLINNAVVNGTNNLNSRSELLNNFNLSGSYFDGEVTIDLDLYSSVGYRGVSDESIWNNISFTAPDGFELLEDTNYTRNVKYIIDNSNYLMNVVLKKNNVVPVINLKVDGEGPKNLFNTGFYTRFKHPLDSNYFEEIKKKYNSLNPNGYSFGVLFVNDKPVGYDNKFMDSSGNSTGINAFSAVTGDKFSFKLLVDPNKYEFGGVSSNYYDPYKDTKFLPKTGEYIKKTIGTEEFNSINLASLRVDDLIDKNAFPIYTVELNSRVYTINIAKSEGFEISSYTETTNYGGSVKFTIASDQHKMPKISIIKEGDGTDLLSGNVLTPLRNRYYIPNTKIPYVMLGSYLKSGAMKNGKLVQGSDYTGNLGVDSFGAITENNLTGKHDIIINFAHPEGSTNIYEGNYKIFIEYDNK